MKMKQPKNGCRNAASFSLAVNMNAHEPLHTYKNLNVSCAYIYDKQKLDVAMA